MDQQDTGGSNAQDFQPPTGNPQSDVGGGLQPNAANLQPVPGAGSTTNPQNLPTTNNLQVASNGLPASAPIVKTTGIKFLPAGLVILIFFVLLAVAVAVAFSRRSKRASTNGVAPETSANAADTSESPAQTSLQEPVEPKPKKPKKSTSRRSKKSSRRKRRK